MKNESIPQKLAPQNQVKKPRAKTNPSAEPINYSLKKTEGNRTSSQKKVSRNKNQISKNWDLYGNSSSSGGFHHQYLQLDYDIFEIAKNFQITVNLTLNKNDIIDITGF